VEGRRVGVPGILWPAVLLHGTFDFLLMMMAAIQFGYDYDENVFSAVSLAMGG